MIIDNVITESLNNRQYLRADVKVQGDKWKRVFFAVSNKYSNYVYYDSSPFLASFLLPAMKQKEDITVKGIISSKVSRSIEAVSELVSSWRTGFYKVQVNVPNARPDGAHPTAVGCFFTGGVDSFYTFLKHRSEITHLIIIHGCDIPLKDKEFFSIALDTVKKVAAETKIKVIVVESNYREVIEPLLEWEWELGSALSAVALFLRNGFKKIYIPGGMKYDQLCPYGTHPDLDPLWSSERLKIVHDGCEFSRLEKVMHSISKSSLALRHLRVCCYILKGKYNCNNCF
ncbi:hypothetical protein HGB07_08110, partial [Candidatus Roizmanbacteria bacterium]|nr:hypothetical protein [Candidatus Roizmanbacteria bacterium]